MKNTLSIKEIPREDRPRERLLKYGAEVLSNSELLAVIIGKGTRNQNAITLAQNILGSNEGLKFLCTSSVQELLNINGIGNAKVAIIKASIELGRRMRSFRTDEKIVITSPKNAADLLIEDMRYLKKEHFRVMFLNTKNQVIDVSDLSIGTLNSSIVHPREVFYDAIKKVANSIVICHNHPSGDPTPSKEDINVTSRLREVGKLIGIELLDHIIIGDGVYVSLKEKGLI
ncbi:MAG: DNA repair protein RadC [Clostridium sp.]